MLRGIPPLEYWGPDEWREARAHCAALKGYFEALTAAARFSVVVFYDNYEAGLDLEMGDFWACYWDARAILVTRNELHIGKRDQTDVTIESAQILIGLAEGCRLPGVAGRGFGESLSWATMECVRASATRGEGSVRRLASELTAALVRVSERRGPSAKVLKQEAALGLWWLDSCVAGRESELVGDLPASWWWRPFLYRDAYSFLCCIRDGISRCETSADVAARVQLAYPEPSAGNESLFASFVASSNHCFREFARTVALARLARAGLAVALHHEGTGEWPDQLSQAYDGPAVDPFSGDRFVLEHSATSIRLVATESREELPPWEWSR
jgi:hypothetical protein